MNAAEKHTTAAAFAAIFLAACSSSSIAIESTHDVGMRGPDSGLAVASDAADAETGPSPGSDAGPSPSGLCAHARCDDGGNGAVELGDGQVIMCQCPKVRR
jgi:hypothetical protein